MSNDTDNKANLHDMDEGAQPAASQQSGKPTLNFPKLLDLCGGVLSQAFFKLPKEKSKELFQQMKKGEQPQLGEVTLGEKIKLKLKIALDHREFVGPGFNFDLFRPALGSLLERIASTLKLKADLNLRTNNSGGVLVGFAGGYAYKNQLNTIMMAIDMGKPGEVTVRLFYVDPKQFEDKM